MKWVWFLYVREWDYNVCFLYNVFVSVFIFKVLARMFKPENCRLFFGSSLFNRQYLILQLQRLFKSKQSFPGPLALHFC